MENENLNEAEKPVEMKMTEQEYQLMERIRKQSIETSEDGCMPTMIVRKNSA